MPIKTVDDLFIHELSDMYSAEEQMTRSIVLATKLGLKDAQKLLTESLAEERSSKLPRLSDHILKGETP